MCIQTDRALAKLLLRTMCSTSGVDVVAGEKLTKEQEERTRAVLQMLA